MKSSTHLEFHDKEVGCHPNGDSAMKQSNACRWFCRLFDCKNHDQLWSSCVGALPEKWTTRKTTEKSRISKLWTCDISFAMTNRFVSISVKQKSILTTLLAKEPPLSAGNTTFACKWMAQWCVQGVKVSKASCLDCAMQVVERSPIDFSLLKFFVDFFSSLIFFFLQIQSSHPSVSEVSEVPATPSCNWRVCLFLHHLYYFTPSSCSGSSI